MKKVTTIESGTVTREMTASRGLIQNIIARTPRIVSAEVSSWLSPC